MDEWRGLPEEVEGIPRFTVRGPRRVLRRLRLGSGVHFILG